MKIVHVISGLKIGGAESALLNFLSKVVKDNDEHFVIYFHHGANVEKINALGIKTFNIQGIVYRYDPFCYFRLCKLIKHLSPDVIHTACWSANFFGRLVAKKLNIPVICDIHGNSFDEGAFRNFLDRLTVCIPAKFVAVSEQAKSNFVNNIVSKVKNIKQIEKLKAKVVTINNGIDAKSLECLALQNPLARKDLGIAADDFVIGAVGRLEKIKSYDVLVNAFALFAKSFVGDGRFNNTKLCLVGDGSQMQNLQTLVDSFGISEKVIFVGQRDDAFRFYSLFDCFALSSQSEGLSIALLEAMVFGVPVVTTHNALTHDVIKQGINGFFVPTNNIYLMANVFRRLQQDNKLVEKIRMENKKMVYSTFSLDGSIEQCKKLYTEIISRQ